MALIRNETKISSKDIQEFLISCAPERREEVLALWERYDPEFALADDGAEAYLSANKTRVVFDRKTLAVYWLLSYAGWKTLASYAPAVVCSLPAAKMSGAMRVLLRLLPPGFPAGTTVQEILTADHGLADAESELEGAIRLAKEILNARAMPEDVWPADVPSMDAKRNSLSVEDGATFDLAWLSMGYAFCHELRHLMYAKDQDAPDRRVEELQCDLWARTFLTEKVADYAQQQRCDADRVLAKRSIGGVIGMFVLYETTPRSGDVGSDEYPPFADRIEATLADTSLGADHDFWIACACMLVAILRRRRKAVDVSAASAKELCQALLERVRVTA